MKLIDLKASKVKDCRGKDTIKIEIYGKNKQNFSVFSIAPNGTSKGIKEVRDFSIKGLDYSINLANKFGKEIIKFINSIDIEGNYIEILSEIEKKARNYDSSYNLREMGGNALYAIEAALTKAIAKLKEREVWQILIEQVLSKPAKLNLPLPVGNCIGGGKHVESKQKPEFQEFLLIPKTKRFFEAYFIMQQAYKKAKELLEKRKKFTGRWTIENALLPLLNNTEVLNLLLEVKDWVKENFNTKLELGLDIAATSFFENNVYVYKTKKLSASRQLDFIFDLIKNYNLFYIEDPFEENDFNNFSKLLAKVNKERINCLIVGDDLTCTNPKYVKEAIKKKAINALIIKPNQIGSLLTTLETIKIAKQHGLNCIISHRSGESIDDFIADLAIGWQIPFIKTGIIGKEREVKLRRIIAIEKSLRINSI